MSTTFDTILSVNTNPPPALLKALVPALAAILAGAVVQQLQTDWGWAAILLVGAVLVPLAIWWGIRDPRAERPLIRYGFSALAIAYVLLTAAFSVFGDQLGWLWRVSVSAPIATAAIAVLLLTRESPHFLLPILGVTAIGVGVAGIGFGVALTVDNDLAGSIAVIGGGLALIGFGVAMIVDNRLVGTVAVIGCGVTGIGYGVALIFESHLVGGVYAIGLGVAVIGLYLVVDNRLVGGVAEIGVGIAVISLSVAMIVNNRLAEVAAIGMGVAAICFGVALIGFGVAMIGDNRLVGTVAAITMGVAAIGFGVALTIDFDLALGIAEIGFGVVAIAFGVVVIGRFRRDTTRSARASAEDNDEAAEVRSESTSANSHERGSVGSSSDSNARI